MQFACRGFRSYQLIVLYVKQARQISLYSCWTSALEMRQVSAQISLRLSSQAGSCDIVLLYYEKQ